MEIRTSIISVGDIDTVGQQFKCDIYLTATWEEPQLKGKRTEVRLHVAVFTYFDIMGVFLHFLLQNPINLI